MCILVFWIEQKESATWILSTFATFATDLIRLVCFHGNTLLSIWSFLKCHIISTIRLFRAYSSIHSNTESENLVSVKQSWTKRSMVSSIKFLSMGGGTAKGRGGEGHWTLTFKLNPSTGSEKVLLLNNKCDLFKFFPLGSPSIASRKTCANFGQIR